MASIHNTQLDEGECRQREEEEEEGRGRRTWQREGEREDGSQERRSISPGTPGTPGTPGARPSRGVLPARTTGAQSQGCHEARWEETMGSAMKPLHRGERGGGEWEIDWIGYDSVHNRHARAWAASQRVRGERQEREPWSAWCPCPLQNGINVFRTNLGSSPSMDPPSWDGCM